VDNYGACFHNVDMPVSRNASDWVAVKERTLKEYKFAIAFENKVQVIDTTVGAQYTKGRAAQAPILHAQFIDARA
jgi:hypothetical protein